MDLSEIGLDQKIITWAEGKELEKLVPFIEIAISRINRSRENINAQVNLDKGKAIVLLLTAADWLHDKEKDKRALIILDSEKNLKEFQRTALSLSEACGFSMRIVTNQYDSTDDSANLVMGTVNTLFNRQKTDTLSMKDFTFVAISDADMLYQSGDISKARALKNALLAPTLRRSVIFSSHIDEKIRTFAYEMADNPSEIFLEADSERAMNIPQISYYVESGRKFHLLLGLLASNNKEAACIFCNLENTAEEIVRRLESNGIKALLSAKKPSPQKLSEIYDRINRKEIKALVLTDNGAEGIVKNTFRLLINHDLPLEGNFYISRTKLLSKDSAKIINIACDRYVYGIAAIEQTLGISLEVMKADEQMFAKIDKSKDTKPDLIQGEKRFGQNVNRTRNDRQRNYQNDRDHRKSGNHYHEKNSATGNIKSPHPGKITEQNKRTENLRKNNYNNRDLIDESGRRQTQIRNHITEATGGIMDMPGGAFHSLSAKTFNSNAEQKRSSSFSKHKNEKRQPTHIKNRTTPLSDPYSISMEDRIKFFKEKYGKKETPVQNKTGGNGEFQKRNFNENSGHDSGKKRYKENQNTETQIKNADFRRKKDNILKSDKKDSSQRKNRSYSARSEKSNTIKIKKDPLISTGKSALNDTKILDAQKTESTPKIRKTIFNHFLDFFEKKSGK